jgi:hypothetical protein
MELRAIAPGRYAVTLRAGEMTSDPMNVVLGPGDTLDLGTITLRGGMTLVGLIVTSDDRPVEAARVRLAAATDDVGETRSDATGMFEVAGLLPDDELMAWITAEGFAPWQKLLGRADLTPNPLRLEMTRGCNVSVAVIGASGEPVQGAIVRYEGAFMSEREGVTDAEGHVLLTGIATGDGFIRWTHLKQRISCEEGQDIDVEMREPRGGVMAIVSAPADLACEGQSWLNRLDGDRTSLLSKPWRLQDGTWRDQFTGVRDGEYYLVLEGRCEGWRLAPDPRLWMTSDVITVGPSAPSAEVRATLAPLALRVVGGDCGTVLSEKRLRQLVSRGGAPVAVAWSPSIAISRLHSVEAPVVLATPGLYEVMLTQCPSVLGGRVLIPSAGTLYLGAEPPRFEPALR